MKLLNNLGVLCILSMVSSALAAQTSTQVLMRQKLENIHGLLEGLIREDYVLLQKNAMTLENISKVTTWHKQEDPAFLNRAQSFQHSAQFLVEQARAKNLEGVAIGYIRLTLDCMQCHNFVREGRTK